jgi:membrane protein involved in colicin uptake
MEVAESKGRSPHDSVQRSVPAEAKDAHAAQEPAEAKATAADSQSTQQLPLATETRAPPAPDSPEMAAAAEVVEDIVNSVAIAGTTTSTRPPARSGGSRPSGRAKEKQPAGRSLQKRRRAVPQEEDEDTDVEREEVSYAGRINIRWWGGRFVQHIN